MAYSLSWRRYRRPFPTPLNTGASTWTAREGLILHLLDADGRIFFGEVSPVPWFPVESLEKSIAFLDSLERRFDPHVTLVPDTLPCTRFAFTSALTVAASDTPGDSSTLHCAGLLPAGSAALEMLSRLLDQGYTSFKWKAGVFSREEEWRVARRLFQKLVGRGILRIDVNGAFSTEELRAWVSFLKEFPLDYLEQPMPPGNEDTAHALADEHGLTLAWDESACSLASLQRLSRIHPGAVLVVKPSQCGEQTALLDWLAENPRVRRVYSSALETTIGYHAVCRFCARDRHAWGPAGLGIARHLPADGLGPDLSGPLIHLKYCSREKEVSVWNRLS